MYFFHINSCGWCLRFFFNFGLNIRIDFVSDVLQSLIIIVPLKLILNCSVIFIILELIVIVATSAAIQCIFYSDDSCFLAFILDVLCVSLGLTQLYLTVEFNC